MKKQTILMIALAILVLAGLTTGCEVPILGWKFLEGSTPTPPRAVAIALTTPTLPAGPGGISAATDTPTTTPTTTPTNTPTNVPTNTPMPINFSYSISGYQINLNPVNVNTAKSITWSYGDGEYSYMTTPSHIYTLPGTYTVMLTATWVDDSNSMYTRTITIPSPTATPTMTSTNVPTSTPTNTPTMTSTSSTAPITNTNPPAVITTTTTVLTTTPIAPSASINPPGKWLGSNPNLTVRLVPGPTYALNISMMMPPQVAKAGKGGEVNVFVKVKSNVAYVDLTMDGTVYQYDGELDSNAQHCFEIKGGITLSSLPDVPDVFTYITPCGTTTATAPYPILIKKITWKAAPCSLTEPREEHPVPELGNINDAQCYVELQFWNPNVPVKIVLFRIPDGKIYSIGPFRGTLVSRPTQPHKFDLPNYTIVTLDDARATGIQIPNDVVPYDPLP